MIRSAFVAHPRLARKIFRFATTRGLLRSQAASFIVASKANSEDFTFPLAALLTFGTVALASCENTPFGVDKDNIEDAPTSLDHLPEYTLEQVAKNNGENGTPIWVSYGGMVYDVTDFIANHPGGSEKIMQAAGNVSVLNCSCEDVTTSRFLILWYVSNAGDRTILVYISTALCIRLTHETYGTYGCRKTE
jgi:predicted heme/steroid binding protein